MYREPIEILHHKCEFPEANRVGTYFECDTCGKDYVCERGVGGRCWRRVRWSERKKIRARVGIDEDCHLCGYRAFRNVQKNRQFSRGANVQYFCAYHTEQIKHMPIPDMLM